MPTANLYSSNSRRATFRRPSVGNFLTAATAFILAKTVDRTPLASCALIASNTLNIENIGMCKGWPRGVNDGYSSISGKFEMLSSRC